MPDNVIVKVNNAEQSKMEIDLLEATVDTSLFLPAMFSITLQDEKDPMTGKYVYADSDIVAVGAQVEILMETDGGTQGSLIKGEVTAIEPSFAPNGISLIRIRGYDKTHRLTRGSTTRVFGAGDPDNATVTLSDVASKIGGEAGLSVTTDSTLSSLRVPYVMQYNQSNMDFLRSRARRFGAMVHAEGTSLKVEPVARAASAFTNPLTLVWPDDLSSFEPRLTLMHQVDSATAKGWDPQKKQAIVGEAASDASASTPRIGLGKKGSALAKEKLGAAKQTIVNVPVTSVDEAKKIAEAALGQAEGEFITAEGSCRQGDPRILPGKAVKIEGVGTRFGGSYYVTEATHTFVDGSYRTKFTVSGRTPRTMSYLLNEDDHSEQNRIYGVVPAVVTKNDDPKQLGKVRVKFPWLDDQLESAWARVATPMAGADRGFYFLPEVNDEVLVAFEHGDINFPYVVGTLWNSVDKPPKGLTPKIVDAGKTNEHIIRSRCGHLIILDDTQGAEKITIQDKDGKNSIVIDSKANTMTVTVEKDLTVTAKGKISVESTTGEMAIKAKGDLNVECANFNVKSKGNAKIEATGNVDVKGNGQANLTGAQTTVTGNTMTQVKSNTMVQVQSTGMVKVQGNPIMLN